MYYTLSKEAPHAWLKSETRDLFDLRALDVPVLVHGRMGGAYHRDVEGVLRAIAPYHMLISVRDEHRDLLRASSRLPCDAAGWRWHLVYGFTGTRESRAFLMGPIKVLRILLQAGRAGARSHKSRAFLAAVEAERAHRVGQCGVCEGDFIAHPTTDANQLVLHGYERPGTGEIHGRCPGAGTVSFELAPDAARQYLEEVLEPQRAAAVNYARSLATAIQVVEGSRVWQEGEPDFVDARERCVQAAYARAAQLTRECARRRARLESWAPRRWPRVDAPASEEVAS